jgi:hypothetical protein
MKPSAFPIGSSIEKDPDIAAALSWLAECSGAPEQFWKRLESAQDNYRTFVANADVRGSDPAWTDLGTDRVAAYLAQAKSLLDDRASYDFALVAHVAPWLKQLGANIDPIRRVGGAEERARRMLRNATVLPDTAFFELVMASNYAAEGFDVAFISEGAGKTPDLRLLAPGTAHSWVVELKRLQRGQYEIGELQRHSAIFRQAEVLISKHRLSVDIDVTYDQELVNVPDDYLAQAIERFLSNPIALPGGYPWKDSFGSGTISAANVAAVRRDTRNSYLYFGTKMARLLSGRRVFENNYHLAADATPHPHDSRYIDELHYGSVVTWRSASSAAIERKARYVRSKLAEAEQQIVGHGRGIVHIAMDVELESEASDLRRQRNSENMRSYQMTSDTVTVYLHYFVPRISEDHAWLTDETVDVFSRFVEPPPVFPAFPDAPKLKNALPAWRQPLGPSS